MNFKNHFSELPAVFYSKMAPECVPTDPTLVHANKDVSQLIECDVTSPDFLEYFSGRKQIPGSDPLATVYSGHQFGHYSGQLGDGRALLMGQVQNASGELWEIQLKGSGKTPFSRFGDGRAVMRSCIREYLCSEAMFYLGIPTTRALTIIGTGESVQRETLEPGAILTRVAQSHIRFGHFEHFYYAGQHDHLKVLTDHVIDHYFPLIKDKENRYELWFSEVVRLTAELIAAWQSVGFVHGVMNTDNMSILGLTLDYGPFGFTEAFDPEWICNHSDEHGRYTYHQQAGIALWNLHALAHAVSPLLHMGVSEGHLAKFETIFWNAFQDKMLLKLGLGKFQESDRDLIGSLLALMIEQRSDFTQTFRCLGAAHSQSERWLSLFKNPLPAQTWLQRYHERLGDVDVAVFTDKMNAVNPKYVLRNWVAEWAIRSGDVNTIYTLIRSPYEEHSEYEFLSGNAPNEFADLCISCSS